jgi:hypothetical protein
MSLGENCSSRCETRNHATFGECIKNKGVSFAPTVIAKSKKWDTELDAYADARKQGIQPDGTKLHNVRQALDLSDKVGAAYGKDFAVADSMGD